jgi:hypothetical protein
MPTFEDIRPSQKALFLAEARERYPDVDPIGLASGPRPVHAPPRWGCGQCGCEFRLADVEVVDRGPVCPICGVSGWKLVCPLGNPVYEH